MGSREEPVVSARIPKEWNEAIEAELDYGDDKSQLLRELLGEALVERGYIDDEAAEV